jgi:hypothetical protein
MIITVYFSQLTVNSVFLIYRLIMCNDLDNEKKQFKSKPSMNFDETATLSVKYITFPRICRLDFNLNLLIQHAICSMHTCILIE